MKKKIPIYMQMRRLIKICYNQESMKILIAVVILELCDVTLNSYCTDDMMCDGNDIFFIIKKEENIYLTATMFVVISIIS